MEESTTTAPAEPGQEPAGGDGSKPPTEPKVFDEAYVKTLRKEAAATRTELNAAKTQLQELLDRDKSESERLSARATESTRRAEEAEAKALRYEVAAENGLDMTAAGFLTGTTREEIDAKAKELAVLLDKTKTETKPPAGSFDGGARPASAPPKEPVAAHNDFLMGVLGRTPPAT